MTKRRQSHTQSTERIIEHGLNHVKIWPACGKTKDVRAIMCCFFLGVLLLVLPGPMYTETWPGGSGQLHHYSSVFNTPRIVAMRSASSSAVSKRLKNCMKSSFGSASRCTQPTCTHRKWVMVRLTLKRYWKRNSPLGIFKPHW